MDLPLKMRTTLPMARIINNVEDAVHYARDAGISYDVDKWLSIALARQLLVFICNMATNQLWLVRAQAALQMRVAEDAAKTSDRLSQQTDRLIQHTEPLTKQTDTHIKHSEKLTQQTDVLITESRRLRNLNWGLIILTFGLLFLTAGLLYIDWHREHQPITQTTNSK
jgi:hypothetical protein